MACSCLGPSLAANHFFGPCTAKKCSRLQIWVTITGGKLKCNYLFNQLSIQPPSTWRAWWIILSFSTPTADRLTHWRANSELATTREQLIKYLCQPCPAILCRLSPTKNTVSSTSEYLELGSPNLFLNLIGICTARRTAESAAVMAPLGRHITQRKPAFQLTLLIAKGANNFIHEYSHCKLILIQPTGYEWHVFFTIKSAVLVRAHSWTWSGDIPFSSKRNRSKASLYHSGALSQLY